MDYAYLASCKAMCRGGAKTSSPTTISAAAAAYPAGGASSRYDASLIGEGAKRSIGEDGG